MKARWFFLYTLVFSFLPIGLVANQKAVSKEELAKHIRPVEGPEMLELKLHELKESDYYPEEIQGHLEAVLEQLQRAQARQKQANVEGPAASNPPQKAFSTRRTTGGSNQNGGRRDPFDILEGIGGLEGADSGSLTELLELMNRLLLGHGLNTDEVSLELLAILEREAQDLGLQPAPRPEADPAQQAEATPEPGPLPVADASGEIRKMLHQSGFKWSPYREPPYRNGDLFFTPSTNKSPAHVVACGDLEGKLPILQGIIEKNAGSSESLFVISADKPAQGGAPFIFEHGDIREEKWVSMPNEDWMFVFMGDAPDHGPNTLNSLRFLVELKKAYPTRVVLLLGNRDINKLRFLTEFGPGRNNVNTRPFPLLWQPMPFEEAATQPTADGTDYLFSDIMGLPMTESASPLPKFYWVLQQTMGAGRAFASRQQELQTLFGPDVDVHSMRVYRSLAQEDLAPGTSIEVKEGLMRQYLMLADMFHIHEPSGTLFVHGHAGKTNVLEYPVGYDKNPIEFAQAPDVKRWLSLLNAWAHAGIIKALQTPGIESKHIESLIAYVEPMNTAERDANNAVPTLKESVIQNRYCGGTHNPSLESLDAQTLDLLKSSGISRIVVGHTPYGGVPVCMREDSTSSTGNPLEVYAIDNSFAETLFDKSNPYFGSYIHIQGNRVDIHGGFKVDGNLIEVESSNEDPLVGHVFGPGIANVVAKMPNGDYLLFVKRSIKNAHFAMYYTVSQKTLRACVQGQGAIENLVDWLIEKYDKKSALCAEEIEANYEASRNLVGQDAAVPSTQASAANPATDPYVGQFIGNTQIRVLRHRPNKKSAAQGDAYVLIVPNNRHAPRQGVPRFFKILMKKAILEEYMSGKRDPQRLIEETSRLKSATQSAPKTKQFQTFPNPNRKR